MFRNLPVANPQPDARRFVDGVFGRAHPARPPLVEYLIDSEVIIRPVVTEMLGRAWMPYSTEPAARAAYLDNFMAFYRQMGYDVFKFERGLPWNFTSLLAPDTAEGSERQRGWANEHSGPIGSWADFERYPWPAVEAMDFGDFDYVARHMPEGMGMMPSHSGGPLEVLTRLFSYEGLCLALHDNSDLVRAVIERIDGLMDAFYRHLLDLDNAVAIFPGDDMGFRSATLIGPKALRAYTLPVHKKLAGMAHTQGLPYFLHSCGNLTGIMEDLIEDVRIDAKHSYEDAIIPVEDFQARYGERIGVFGGVDINILAGAGPEDVRRRVRQLIDICGTRGRYAVGSGNSIPTYIPLANYLAMVDEALN